MYVYLSMYIYMYNIEKIDHLSDIEDQDLNHSLRSCRKVIYIFSIYIYICMCIFIYVCIYIYV
jgi:hypothetical protein